MRYVSTRGQSPPVSFLDAVLAGLAPDGGLYVPESWPNVFDGDEGIGRDNAATALYEVAASEVLAAFSQDDLSHQEAFNATFTAYFGDPGGPYNFPTHVTPLVQIGSGRWVLELFHGPSLSFKDVAMQLIGPLYEFALAKRDQRLSVVCATSGDTGGAAVEALKGRERADLFVLLPKGRVSDVQRLFMTASGASNVHAIEIDSDFDACQAIVKSMFADRDFSARASLSGVNSINWARIVAQSVYYHVAANILSAPGPVSFAVPTGNFGDAFSGYVAKQCGAPIGQILIATNSNDILARALNTGRYERAAHSHATLSPAMDIQVASNFERMLFEALDRDGDAVRRLYEQFAQSGEFDIPRYALDKMREHFAPASVDDAETADEMRVSWASGEGYLACPHTAVAMRAQRKVNGMNAPIVTLATAHPAKFPDTVEAATGLRPPLPARCADLFERTEKFDTLPAEVEAVKSFIRERTRAWR